MATKEVEQNEFGEIDGIVPILWKEGLITDIDCRTITSCNTLMEKKGAVYTVIMSKPKEEAYNLFDIFRKMTETIHAKENSISFPNINSYDDQNNLLPSQNPLMNSIIIKNVFGFLPLDDIKRSRLVCREWNSAAEICLRKRSVIHFRPSVLLPHTFMEIAKYTQPDLPFPSFAFSNYKNLGWDISDIQDFLEKWKGNIKEVSFNSIKLVRKSIVTDKEVLIRNYDLSPLFINPSNITSLKINPIGEDLNPKRSFDISLEKFVSIKTLNLSYCRIIVSPKSQITRVAPHSVVLNRVSFMRKAKLVKRFQYNDLLDFNKVINLHLEQESMQDGILDMGKQVFNVNRMHLVSVYLKNWTQAKGSVECAYFCNVSFERKNHLKIKLLGFIEHIINLTALPQSLEILSIAEDSEFVCTEPLHLPNLKYLSIDIKDNANLAYFSNCVNLVELEILNDDDAPMTEHYKLSLSCVPKSVKKMKIKLVPITFNDDCIFELDTLILECCNVRWGMTDCVAITAQIKAKVLVIVFNQEQDIGKLDFEKLRAANKQLKKLIIGSNSDPLSPFEGNDLSQYVDKKFSHQSEDVYAEFDKYNMNNYFLP